MPHIIVQMYPGRDDTIKMELAQAIVDTVSTNLGLEEGVISVGIEEIPKEEWKTVVYDKVVEDENKTLYIKPAYKM